MKNSSSAVRPPLGIAMQDHPEESSQRDNNLPKLNFHQASSEWLANKTRHGSSMSDAMQYFRCIGDDVYVNAGSRWRRGHVVKVTQNYVDVNTSIGTIKGVLEDRAQIQCWSSTEFVEHGNSEYDHRPNRRKESRVILGEQVTSYRMRSLC